MGSVQATVSPCMAQILKTGETKIAVLHQKKPVRTTAQNVLRRHKMDSAQTTATPCTPKMGTRVTTKIVVEHAPIFARTTHARGR